MSLSGVLVFIRHGDRKGFYQSPSTYAAVQTNLTTLGTLQQFRNGADLRAKYILPDGPTHIAGINPDKAEGFSMSVIADGGGEGSVIVDSAQALFQGLYPPFNETELLANGTTVSWTRAQVQDMQTIEANDQYWFEGWTDCNAWDERLGDWYRSSEFKDAEQRAGPFFDKVRPLVQGRKVDLSSMWNVWDYINVNNIHNASFSTELKRDPTLLPQARYWGSFKESGTFSSPDKKSIANVAGTAFLPVLLANLQNLGNASEGLKWVTLAASYKPFLALGSLLENDQLRTNVVDYASSMVFEVYSNDTVAISFRNATTDAEWSPLPVFGGSNRPALSEMLSKLEPYSLNSWAAWCDACHTTNARGCAPLAQLNGTGGAGYASIRSTQGRHRVSPVVAGVIGAMVTLAVVALFACLAFLGYKIWGAGGKRSGHKSKSSIAPLDEGHGQSTTGASSAIPLRTQSRPGSLAHSDFTSHLPSEHSHSKADEGSQA